MLRKSLLLMLCTSSWIFANNIQGLVQNTFEQNYTLIGLEKAIKTADENIKLASKWQNPILTLGINDVQSGDISRRDLEPMQAHYVGITQVVPLSDKLDIQAQIAQKDKQITQYVLDETKLKLKSKIYELYFTLAILEKKEALFEQYLKNIEQLKSLNVALYENNKALHTQVINSDILYHKVKLKRKKLTTLIQNLYIKLQEITQQEVTQVSIALKMMPKRLDINYMNHPKIQIQSLKVQRFNDVEHLELEKKIPDVKVNMAYFQRDDKYEDYFNFSVGFPLAIYGSENIKALQAKSKSYEERSRLDDLKKSFKSNIELLQNELNNAYDSYEILHTNIIPSKRKVQDSLEAYNSLQKIKPEALIQNLNELIGFELEALDEQKNYYSYLAQAIYYGYTLEQ